MSAELTFVLSQFTRLTDGQTDGFTIGKTTLNPSNAVKTFVLKITLQLLLIKVSVLCQ